jgi:outer membrane protein OmpA-like peptidoglycan-associated protein/Tol biopolymer transport system component
MKNVVRVLMLICICIIPAELDAQRDPGTKSKKAIEDYNNGLRQYSLHNYTVAERYFLSAIEEDPLFMDPHLVLAEVYEDLNQPLDAIGIYRKGLSLNNDFYPYGFVRLGNLELSEGMYEEARLSYEQFLNLQDKDPNHIDKAREGLLRCNFAINALKNPVDFNPVNLGPSVNTAGDEYWPSISADEQTLVITRLVKSEELPGKVQEDFYISKWQDDGWEVMKSAGSPLNTSDNEGAQTLSGDGRYMVFTACNRKDGLGRCDLYFTVKEGDKWSTPRNIGSPVNTKYRETQPSLSSDGRTLFFSSDRPGGTGLHDIWVSTRNENDQWLPPENLGNTVNTRGIEMSPFIHPDNRSLYFSSDGHLGLGGYDLFVARKDSLGKWQNAVNLGYPINTHRDEIGLVVNSRGDKAYYASDVNKANGKDIYIFNLPVQSRPGIVNYMKGKVFDASSLQVLKAQFELIDLENGNTIYQSYSDSLTGEFLVSIPTQSNYMLNASRKGYLFYSENFALRGIYDADKPFLKDVPLQPLEVGKSIILKNVFYEVDSFALKTESEAELNKVVKFLQQNPHIRIEISGHTDNTGNPDYNQLLSENRAKTAASYLVAASIRSERIVSKGYGMNTPVATNDTEAGRALNRRTELKIIE